VGVGSVCGEVSTERISIMVIVVSWVHERSLGADSDTVPPFLRLLEAWFWGPVAANSIQFNSRSYLMQPEYGDLAMQAFVERRGT
jgi:hypothetical protein